MSPLPSNEPAEVERDSAGLHHEHNTRFDSSRSASAGNGEGQWLSRYPGALTLIAVLANVVTLAWAALAAFVSGRGFGLGNEGFYLLSYEYWDRDLRNFTGVQYLYGPVFDLVGHDLATLRVFRLATVLAVHVFFGVSFARWLRWQRPPPVPTAGWVYCVASVVVVSSPVVYGWLPPTPGYNDITLLGSMTMVALLLVQLRAVDAGRAAPWWTGVIWGFTAGAFVLAKPPGVVSVLVLGLASAFAVRRGGGRLLRPTVAVVTGGVLFAVVVQLFVLPWTDIVPPLREELGVVSSSTHSPLDTLRWYAESSFDLLRVVLVVCAPTAIAASVVLVLRQKLSSHVRLIAPIVGLVASLALLAGAGGLRAGAYNVVAYASGIVAMLLIGVVSAIRGRPVWRKPDPVSATVIGLLLLVPPLQGFGTNNALYAVAVNGTGLWLALMLLLLTRSVRLGAPRTALLAACTASAALLSVVVGVDGITHDGSGRALLSGAMSRVGGSSELSSISLPVHDAARLTLLREDLGIGPGTHRPMLAFGELSHYVLVLGGRPVGSAWYSSDDDGLNAADLRSACRRGNPWGDAQPLVVASRGPSEAELSAWNACGIDFERDYADVTPPSAPDGIRILRWTGRAMVANSSALP